MPKPVLPLDADTLTAAWLSQVLDVPVVSRQIEQIGQDESFTGGALFRITPEYASKTGSYPISLIAKLAPVDLALRQTLAAANRREVEFYVNFSAQKNLQVPDCYFGAFDPGTRASVLLLEDLGHTRAGDFITGCSIEDATAVTDATAEIHAQFWDSEDVQDLSGSAILEEFDISGAWSRYPEKLANLLPEASLPDSFLTLGSFIAEHHLDLSAKLLDQGPVTCLHRDLQADNFRFRRSDGSAILLDWQMRGKGRGIYDLGYFLISSLEPDIRRANEDALLTRYHAALCAGGVKNYSLETCRAEYLQSVMAKFFVTLVATDLLDNSTLHKQAWRRADLKRLLAFCEDHDISPATFT